MGPAEWPGGNSNPAISLGGTASATRKRVPPASRRGQPVADPNRMSDTEITHNPHQPEGWRRDGADFFCRSFSPMHMDIASSSHSPQTSPYL